MLIYFKLVILLLNISIIPHVNLILNLNFNIITLFIQFWITNNTTFVLFQCICLYNIFWISYILKFYIKIYTVFYLLLSTLLYNYLILKHTTLLNYSTLHGYDYLLFNNLLINKINYIHPFLFFLTVSFLLLFWLLIFYYFYLSKPVNVYYLHSISLYLNMWLKTNINYIYLLILLGAWWAFQEGTWGGWWAWDPSELLSLTIFFIVIYLLHIKFILFKLINVLQPLTLLYMLASINYLFLQINFNLTSHNFGNSFNFFTSELFYSTNLVFITLLLTLMSYRFKFFVLFKTPNFTNLPIFFLILIIYIYSNTDLINYVLWVYFSLEFKYISLLFYDYMFYLYFYLNILFSSSNLFIIELLVVYILLSIPLLAQYSRSLNVKSLHMVLIYLINVTFLTTQFDITISLPNTTQFLANDSLNITLFEGIFNYVSITFVKNFSNLILILFEASSFQFFTLVPIIWVDVLKLTSYFYILDFNPLFVPTLINLNLLILSLLTTYLLYYFNLLNTHIVLKDY